MHDTLKYLIIATEETGFILEKENKDTFFFSFFTVIITGILAKSRFHSLRKIVNPVAKMFKEADTYF